MICLNLGCGPCIYPRPWVNADILTYMKPHVQMDVEAPWPWPQNTFDEVRADHIAEHCSDKMHFIRELWRVCRCGAFVRVSVPKDTWPQFWDDPTHKGHWTPETLTWFQQGHTHHNALPFRNGPEFEVVRFELRDGWELSWDLRVVRPGRPSTAESPISLPANAFS